MADLTEGRLAEGRALNEPLLMEDVLLNEKQQRKRILTKGAIGFALSRRFADGLKSAFHSE